LNSADAVRVTSRVEVDPGTAFRLFTEEVDVWWRTGPRFRWHPERGGTLRFEGGPGGRFVEVYPDGASFEVGRIRVWDPPRRLVFGFRARNFAADESTEVEVRFEASGEATDVTVEHRGFAALRADHPVRHGLGVGAFENMMGVFWADLLTAARRHAARSQEGATT
jgi:Activator of Hsp90 ATPase homolog 1-like protein